MKDRKKEFVEYLANLLPSTNIPNPPSFGMDVPWQPSTYQDAGRGVMNALIPEPEDTLMGLMKPSYKPPWQMTKTEFYKKYGQHTNIKGNKIGPEGFRESFNVNAIPATQGQPLNVIDKNYGTIKGKEVIAIPYDKLINGKNGLKVMEGHVPDPSEIVTIKYDYQPLHEAIIEKAMMEGKEIPNKILKDYKHLLNKD